MPGPSVDTSHLKELPFKFGAATRNLSKYQMRNNTLKDLFDALLEKQARREHDKQREQELRDSRELQLADKKTDRMWKLEDAKVERYAKKAEESADIEETRVKYGEPISQAEQLLAQGDEAFAAGEFEKALAPWRNAQTLLGKIPKTEREKITDHNPDDIRSQIKDLQANIMDAQRLADKKELDTRRQNSELEKEQAELLKDGKIQLAIGRLSFAKQRGGAEAVDEELTKLLDGPDAQIFMKSQAIRTTLTQLRSTDLNPELRAPTRNKLEDTDKLYTELLEDMETDRMEAGKNIFGIDALNDSTAKPLDFSKVPLWRKANEDSSLVFERGTDLLINKQYPNTPEGHEAAFDQAKKELAASTGKYVPTTDSDEDIAKLHAGALVAQYKRNGKKKSDISPVALEAYLLTKLNNDSTLVSKIVEEMLADPSWEDEDTLYTPAPSSMGEEVPR